MTPKTFRFGKLCFQSGKFLAGKTQLAGRSGFCIQDVQNKNEYETKILFKTAII